MVDKIGAKVWLIPDGYYPVDSCGKFPSHEAVCLLNPGSRDARVEIVLYFEDRPKLAGFKVDCPAERTRHVRLDRLKNLDGQGVPSGVSYAMMVESDEPLIVQYSRMDTSQAELALMTTMAYPVTE